jgi:L-ribulokinase
MNHLVIGVDFGTDSVRALVVDANTGEELACDTAVYRRWAEGRYCDPGKNQFRHHPLDYIEGLEASIKGALSKLPPEAIQHVVGIGVDTTGSTPVAVDREGRPLALRREFAENPNAMFILWKDHTAVREAGEINQVVRSWGGTDFTRYEGGVYSSEWFWAKILHVLRHDPAVRSEAFSWVELCDWIPALLTGTEHPSIIKRSRCAAGHKAMWHEEWGGLPPEEFLIRIDPLLAGLRERLYIDTYTSDVKAGGLTREWAERLGLRENTPVAVGAFDAHMGAVGGGIIPGILVKIMGTSTCDIMVARKDVIKDKLIAGICGQVDGSVIPGMIGLEAGQSAFGDVYAWFRDVIYRPLETILMSTSRIDGNTAKTLCQEIKDLIIPSLTEEAVKIYETDTCLLALDWLNGRRTPYADQRLKGAIMGLTLGTTAPIIFKALVEATAFGARAINERFIEEGIKIEQVIALGGIAAKNDFVMQVTADILNMPIKVAASEQACALGAAMFGAVVAGLYETVEKAQQKMGCSYSKVFMPDPANAEKYDSLYKKYVETGKSVEDMLRNL